MTSPSQPVTAVDAVADQAGLLRQLEGQENFPVALRLLPRQLRADLRAVYDIARTIDDLGDEAPGDRLALLDDFEADLRRAWTTTEPRLPVVQRLVPVVQAHDLSIDPFLRLVAANRLDQRQSSYPTWNDLRHYCTLSADPVGRIVLAVTDSLTIQRVELSDDVCTALQVLEHCQDVAEDRRHGRIYLPLEDLAEFDVTEIDLDLTHTPASVRRLVGHEVHRARGLLASGPVLVHSLRGSARVAVAGFVAGGLATADALRRADYDVLARDIVPRKRDILRHAIRLLAGRS
ncbi:MAG TPA: squalene synthase HpnC [Mycobacteriales bacterium]|nr:squalene synthase HpnC [Mycobacteriales bacterium]